MDDQEGPPQLVNDHPGATSQSGDEEPDTSEEFNEDDTILPEGNVYPLNSKKIVADQLHRLAGMLGLPSSSTGSSTRQLIEGKLLEMGKEPRNVQVIVSGESRRLYLVIDDGVIATEPEHVSNTDVRAHTTNEFFNNEVSVHELESLRSALREACLENTRLANELHARDESLEVLRGELLTANNEIA